VKRSVGFFGHVKREREKVAQGQIIEVGLFRKKKCKKKEKNL
jgi:hypothetical protein